MNNKKEIQSHHTDCRSEYMLELLYSYIIKQSGCKLPSASKELRRQYVLDPKSIEIVIWGALEEYLTSDYYLRDKKLNNILN